MFFSKTLHIMYKTNIKDFLFKEARLPLAYSVALLAARIVFGVLFMSHGVAKWIAFNEMSEHFPDPLGIGSTLSFWLAILAEIACTFGFMLGALFRLCLIPMIVTMCTALFIVHAGDPLPAKELAVIYLTIFVLLFFSGPGRFSIDEMLRRIMA